jgi:PhnB protein
MLVQPYLSFEGRCEEALDFYKKALDAEVTMMMRNKEAPGGTGPGPAEKIMHSSMKIGDTVVMASDGRCTGKADFSGTSLALTVANEAEAKRRFDALAAGGQVQMPLTKTFFSPAFGMVADRFGVPWMIVAE